LDRLTLFVRICERLTMQPTHRSPRFNRKHFVTLLVLGLFLFITIRYISPRIFSIYRPKKSQQEFVVETLRTSITTSDRGLVVCVHGIGGDRHTTWERKVKNSAKDTDASINVSMLNIALQDKELSSYPGLFTSNSRRREKLCVIPGVS
jgi:hypothetical protein